MITKIPATYKDRDGCVNCKFGKILYEGYEEQGKTFCIIDNPGVSHQVVWVDDAETAEQKAEMQTWFYAHIVSPAGICNKWEKNDEE
jgi:hypothetical protein